MCNMGGQMHRSDNRTRQPAVAACCCIGLVLVMASQRAVASVNLELRPHSQTVGINSIVNLGLYAVWNGQSQNSFAAVDAIIGWDPSLLTMQALSNTGAVPLLSSGFPAHDPYGINEAILPIDGNGLFEGLSNFGSPTTAISGGILLTTFRFLALAQTLSTPVNLLLSAGSPVGHTVVFDGTVANLEITGTLSGATVTIVPEPASCMLMLAGTVIICRRRRRC